ncbi:MAG: Ig-like domain-containing protein [Bacteroidales bacterium]|nr:Ig-like domain-containing protein [Bacteroidales bacterium]
MRISRYIIPAFALLALGIQSCGGDADDIVVDVTEKTYSAATVTNKIETTFVEAQKDGEKVDLYLFDKDNLTYQMAFEAQKNVKYSVTSSDSEVASVDENGLVTALKPGKTTVTLECGSLKKTVEVACHNFKVTREKMECPLSDSKISLKKSESAKLTFKSSNADIVSVAEDGKIKGLALGDATITVSDGVEEVVVSVKVMDAVFYTVDGLASIVDESKCEIEKYSTNDWTFYIYAQDGSKILVEINPSYFGKEMNGDYEDPEWDDLMYCFDEDNNDGDWTSSGDLAVRKFVVTDNGDGNYTFNVDFDGYDEDGNIVPVKFDGVTLMFND